MPTATILRKSFTAIETKVLDASQGLVEATFSVTANEDRQNDKIMPGAFSKAINRAIEKGRPPTVVYGHDWENLDAVLGRAVKWNEMAPGNPMLPEKLLKAGFGGMRAEVKFDLETPAGAVAFTHVKNKNLDEWSFAFSCGDIEYDEKGVRLIKEITEVMEISLVLIGANQDTVTMALKSMKAAPDSRVAQAEAIAAAARAGAAVLEVSEEAAETREEVTVEDEDGEASVAYASLTEGQTVLISDAAGEVLFEGIVASNLWPETKDQPPILTGDEAIHNAALADALAAINALILQEVAEPDGPEYGDIIRLCCIAQDLCWWARGEVSEDDSAFLYAQAPEETKRADGEYPTWMLAGVGMAMSALDSTTVPLHTTPPVEDDPLAALVKAQAS